MRRPLLAAVLMALFAIGPVAAATTTQALPLPQAASCSGVWVVVDYGSLGGTSTRCAASFGTGTAALRSAGFSPTLDGGMITKISGKPSSVDLNKYYWSYWHATRKSDGSYGGWSYSDQGANSSHPTKGNAEGWRYQSLSDGKVPPGVAPPKTVAATPKPKPTATARPKPSATPTTAKPKPRPTATTSASPGASATSAATPSAETAQQTTAETVEPVDVPSDGGTPGGSPVALLATGAAVVAGGAGLGGWWLVKGRKR